MRVFTSIFFILFISPVFGQVVKINKVELAGEKVIVHYNLEDANPNVEYLINLYSSRDNFVNPLSKVSGDVGQEVKPGINKKIIWDLYSEFGPYKGRLSLEIKGRVHVPFVKLNFDAGKNYKKGKSYNITWRTGNPGGRVSIDLMEGNRRVAGDPNVPNNGSHSIFIPADVKPGKEFRLRFTDSANADEVVYTPNFKISSKLPLPVKILGGLVVLGGAAAAATMLGGEGGNNGGGTSTDTDLPMPPLPPGG